MKHFIVWCLLSVMAPVCAQAAKIPPETIIIAADSWCPYTCDEHSGKPGFMIELATQALKPYNITVQYKTMSWARAIELARAGTVAGIAGAARDDAPDFIFPDMLQGLSDIQFWVKKDSNWSYTGVSSLGKVRIGIATGYAYSNNFDLYVRLHAKDTRNIQPINSDDALTLNIRKLEAGLIDVVPEDKSVMQYHYAARGEVMPLRSAGSLSERGELKSNFLYVAFTPANPRSGYYAQILSKRIYEMRKSGELKAILDKYRVDDWYNQTGR